MILREVQKIEVKVGCPIQNQKRKKKKNQDAVLSRSKDVSFKFSSFVEWRVMEGRMWFGRVVWR